MSNEENELQSVLERVSQREASARNRSLLYTLIPILVGLAMIWVTTQSVIAKTQELNAANSQLTETQQQREGLEGQVENLKTDLNLTSQKLESLNTQIGQLQQESQSLRDEVERNKAEVVGLQAERDNLVEQVELLSLQVEESGVLRNKFFEGDILVILKDMSGDYPSQTEMLQEILNYQREKSSWLAGGFGPDQFDSPGFAAYLLTQKGLVNGNPEDIHYKLLNTLPPIDTPENGDIVFYKGGYTMFYFQDPYTQETFVIGMTTFGIVAMKYDFAPIIGIGDVKYP